MSSADQLRIGGCILAERRRRREGKGAYSYAIHRLREIDKVAADRFGRTLPEEADAIPYLVAVGYAANACSADLRAAIEGWCARFAPHLLPIFEALFEPIRMQVEGRRWNLSAADAAALLSVTFADRQRLGLVTIGACDLSAADLRERVAEQRRGRERERLAGKRAAVRQNRRDWLAQHTVEAERPWEALGISRRTWFRRRQDERGTGVLQGARDERGTGVLQIGNPYGGSDTPVPTVSAAEAAVGGGVEPPARSAPPTSSVEGAGCQHETSELKAKQTTGRERPVCVDLLDLLDLLNGKRNPQ